ncbi:uncharacterized protein LOC130814113 isoform X2 [Amaranthus tricolor]|uniref:uncharacterized protein LOC130814113 isoform X2 n=1 Tax=Amaranthus tricolor TaxID=29722 RepID=UPI00258C59C7|nr:uncharacterized protein LOC130814113 isoform X2 [Amaranthus tricolor]
MASSDFAQKLLHDLRLRKERMANAQSSDMYHNSKQNFKGSRETKTLEVSHKAGRRYRGSSNSRNAAANSQSANQIVPYGGEHHAGQLNDLSMALAYAFDNRGKLKILDIVSNGPMMNLLQQIGRTSTQRIDIHWQSENQFPTLTNLHINEISKGAQKLNQLLRACSSGGFSINKGSVEIGNELWKGAMELEQSLRMLVSLQEASTDSTANSQQKSRFRLLDDNGDSEDDSSGSLEKQKQVERPVFSFDKPSKNSKVSVQKLLVQPHLEDPHPKTESHISITSTSTPHRHSASNVSELNTSQLTNSSTLKHNAARLPNVIAKLMGLEELPENSKPKVNTECPATQQRSRDSVSSHFSQRSSQNANLKIEYTRPAKHPVGPIRVQSNTITILTSKRREQKEDTYRSIKNYNTGFDREKPNWKLEERQGIKTSVQRSMAAISKINELQTKCTNLNQESKAQNGISKEAHVKITKQKQAATEISGGINTSGNRSLNMAEITDKLRETKNAEASNLQLPQQKQNREVELQKMNMPNQPHRKKIKAENRYQPKANLIAEPRKRESSAEKVQGTRIIATDHKILQKQANVGINSRKDFRLTASKVLLSDEKNEDPAEDVSKNSNDGSKSSMSLISESGITEVRATSYKEVRSEQKEISDDKPPNTRPTVKTNKDITKALPSPRTITKALKPHKSTLQTLKQNRRNKISGSQPATVENESRSITESTPGKDAPIKPPTFEQSQKNEDTDQVDSRNHTVRDQSTQQRKEVIEITSGDMNEVIITNIHDDQQEMVTDEVKIKPQVTPDGQEDSKINSFNQQKQQKIIKVEKQEPLTEDEMFLKQKLILSHHFLNTAEALFKLNIPISILNYASDQICKDRDCKIILDCGYELLKRKGKRKEAIIYPSINISMSYTQIKSLDDLVRHLHEDFEALRSYGRNEKDNYDYANCILKMLEGDIYNRHPDLNTMWDLGWYDVFPCANMEEVICNIEQLMLDELMNEFTYDCL